MMAGKIFINYRREESIGIAGRLYDRLVQIFGHQNVFMDVDHIPAGIDFVAHLISEVAACDIFLVVIGPRWLDAKDESGQRRLHQPDDFVAIEIAAALTREIRVIPILIDGARMPKAGELPDPLKSLARRQAIELRQNQFGRDAEALVKRIEELLGASLGIRSWRGAVLAAAAIVAGLLVVGWYGFSSIFAERSAETSPSREVGTMISQPHKTEAATSLEQDAEQQRLSAVKAEQERQARAAADEEAKRSAEEAERQRLAAIKAEQEAATHSPTTSAPPQAAGKKIAPDSVPFISERARRALANDYVGASAYKAFALNIMGVSGRSFGQPSEDVAKTVALDQCSQRAEAAQSHRKCELYAVGDSVVYPHGPPPMPPAPWVGHDAATERPFVVNDMPLVRETDREWLETNYLPARKPKSIALAPGGVFFYFTSTNSIEESARRALEACGAVAGGPCIIVAVDDVFVVPVPSLMNATGFFYAATSSSIAANSRDDLVRKLNEASTGWNAVAIGASGNPGLGLKAVSEQDAINDALGDCAKRDSDCRVIAIGPFMVAPK